MFWKDRRAARDKFSHFLGLIEGINNNNKFENVHATVRGQSNRY